MPIKLKNKHRYPDNWDEISQYIRFVRAKNRCEDCGIKNHLVIKRLKGDDYREPCAQEWEMIHSRIKYCNSTMAESIKFHGFIKVVLTTGHLVHQPENCEYSNLRAMCKKCHNNYDKSHRKQTRLKSKYKGINPLFNMEPIN